MTTEITDNRNRTPAGWIFFDAECRFCVAQQFRWGRLFERRGLIWVSIQTPGTAERLGVTERQLQEEMWLQLADGRKFSGAGAWSMLMRFIWWMWPLGFGLALPGFRSGARVLYRWVAKNRHCLDGACKIQGEQPDPARAFKPQARRRRFFDLP